MRGIRHAPIALFAFNRPNHLRRTIESLKRCESYEKSRIFLFVDGARTLSEVELVQATRSVAVELLGTHAEFRFSRENHGLSRSIINGVSEIVERYGRVIVIEDDLLLSRGFLRYVNEALSWYADDERIYQVSGHNFNVPELARRRESMLLPLTTTWGWATWSRAWRRFDPHAEAWKSYALNKKVRHRFNLDGTYDYAAMMERQMRGHVDSWGIRWYWTVFRAGGLSCFPPQSLVINAGMDGSGSHGLGKLRYFRQQEKFGRPPKFVPPRENDVESIVWIKVKKAIWRQNGGNLGKAINILKNIGFWFMRD